MVVPGGRLDIDYGITAALCMSSSSSLPNANTRTMKICKSVLQILVCTKQDENIQIYASI